MTKIWRKVTALIATIMAGLMMLSISVYAVVNNYRSMIDGALGTNSWTTVTDETDDENLYNYGPIKRDGVNIDGEEVEVDTSTLKGLFDYEKDVSMRLAADGFVLLQNENDSLPLAAGENITLLGMRSYTRTQEKMMWGMLSYDIFGTQYGGQMGSVAPGQLVTPIADALEAQGFTVNQTVRAAYEARLEEEANRPDSVFNTSGYQLNETSPDEVGLASMADTFGSTAIVTVGRPAREQGVWYTGDAGKADPSEFDADKDVLGLAKDEIATLQFARENFDNVIVLINAVTMDLPDLAQYADSILYVGLPGVYGFEALARVLDGTISPSGRLNQTFAVKASNALAMVNQQYTFNSTEGIEIAPEKNNEFYVPEVESIYTGYRYYETRYYDTVVNERDARDSVGATDGASGWNYANEVVWGFGYGLSYTTFSEEITSLNVDRNAMTVTAEVEVTNTGDVAGKHAAQLYISMPYFEESGIEKSAIQLIGYDKTGVLAPGASQTLTITADFQDFASWDDELEHHGVQGGYVLEAGDYYFSLGNGIHEAMNNVLAAQGYTVANSGGYMTADGDADQTEMVTMDRVEIVESKAGVQLQNQLDTIDLEKIMPGEVENFSRTSWKDNWPEVYDDLTPTAEMADGLNNRVYTLHANGDPSSIKFGQDYGLNIADLKPAKGERISLDDPRLQQFVEQYDLGDALAQLINGNEYSAGPTTVSGVERAQKYMILDDAPMGFDSQTIGKGAADATKGGPFDGSKDPDYETYKDVPMRTLPTGCLVGCTWNEDLVWEAGEMIGQLALWNGCNGIQAPGGNTYRNAYNARNHEYYSEDGVLAGKTLSAFCGGTWEYGLFATVKHFVFNDTELNRDGVGAYMSEQRAREIELRAFQIGIESGNVVALMTGMNRAGYTFDGAHTGLMQNILRDEWGFEGLVETDMTQGTLDNAIDCFAAGVDSMLQPISADAHAWERDTLLASWGGDSLYATGEPSDAVLSDAFFLGRIQEALKHHTWMYVNSNYMNGKNGSSHSVRVMTWYDNVCISLISGSAALAALSFVGYVILTVKKDKNSK